jgi:hypothetical protein
MMACPVSYRSEETIDIGGRTLPMSCVFDYDTRRWDVRSFVCAFFDTDDLETLHADPRWNPHEPGVTMPSQIITRNSWEVGKTLRDAAAEQAAPVLQALTRDLVPDVVGDIRSIQPLPMMRINFHGSKAILRFHKDREYGQRAETINIWLPVTATYDSNSMYVERYPGSGEFRPVVLHYGQALLFYGTELLHGTLDNMSGGTRISYDFRFSI